MSYGPDNANVWVKKEVNGFLTGSGAWLVQNLHGLDDEGWGAVRSAFWNGR